MSGGQSQYHANADAGTAMQIDQGRLKDENATLVGALRAKDRKQQQTQELYDRLKRKEMTSVTQSAAINSVDEVLGAANSRHNNLSQRQSPNDAARNGFSVFSREQNGHNQDRSNGSLERTSAMPPPFRRPSRNEHNSFGTGTFFTISIMSYKVLSYSSLQPPML